MYLSRLFLNPRCGQVRVDTDSPYEMHRTLLRAFPSGLAPEADRLLWRLDRDKATGCPVVYVQSRTNPDWTKIERAFHGYFLSEQNCPDSLGNPVIRSDYPPRFKTGQTLLFRLRANPTVKKKAEGKKNGKRLGLIDETAQLEWLSRKGEKGGFRLISAVVVREDGPRELQKGCKEKGNGKLNVLSLLSVHFDGTLQVTGPDEFLRTISSGIGSGKALGFGLLSVAPGAEP